MKGCDKMNNKEYNKTKNATTSGNTTQGTSSSQSSKDVTYVDPLPESSRPRKDGPGGN